MRKLLLASAAILGASVGMAAHAYAQQATNDTIGDSVVTLNTTGDSATTDSTDGQSFPTPGTVTVRLNGRYRFYAGVMGQGAARTSNFTGAASSVTTSNGVNNTNIGINKLSNYGTMEYARLYPGFDGVAANGLKYGASLEIREEGNHPAGGSAGSISSSVQSTGTLYFRRQFGYLGTDQFGTIRVGTDDGVSSLYLTGTFENFDGGGWDGDIPEMLPGVDQLAWPFTDAGGGYATQKIVYMSPQFYGFDFGVDWEPTTASGAASSSGCGASQFTGTIQSAGASVAAPGCNNLSSTSTSDQARRKNTFEAAVRYRGTFGAFGTNTSVDVTHSGHVLFSGVTPAQQFQDLNYVQVGSTLTWGGLTVGGNWKYGDFDGLDVPSPDGSKVSTAWIAGASYSVGPVIFGASWIDYIHPNGVVETSTIGSKREQGFAAGATYSLAPGVSLIASYLWDELKQGGVNLAPNSVNAAGTFPSNLNNKVNASVFALGTSFAW
jgi:hypothetical protein